MGFGINTDGIPRLYGYGAASAHEQAVVPIMGGTVKPIGKRRNKHMSIRREGAGTANEAILCRLYNTDCVTYYKDGRVLLQHGGFTGPTTAAFIGAIVPTGYVHSRDSNFMYTTNGAQYLIPHGGLWMRDGVVLDPELFEVHTLKRDVVGPLRNKYKALKDLATALCKLSNGVVPTLEVVGSLRAELPDEYDPTDAELAVKLMHFASVQHYTYMNNQRHRYTSAGMISRTLDHLIFTKYRDELFSTKVLPPGEYKRDAYAKYFK